MVNLSLINPLVDDLNENITSRFCYPNETYSYLQETCHITCNLISSKHKSIYVSHAFWSYVFLRYVGTIGHVIGNSISDATCLDMLGENHSKRYGSQRLWAEFGIGVSALLAGIFNYNLDSTTSVVFTLIMMISFCSVDVFTVSMWLKLPSR